MPTTAEIFEALKDGDIGRIDEFLSQYPQLINAKSDNGETLFLLSIYYGRNEIKELLLSKGYEPNLFEAAAAGNLKKIKEMTEANPELINSFSDDGFTPLGLAAYFGHLEAVKHFLNKGAEVNTSSDNNFRVKPLHSAVSNKNLEIARLLLEFGAEVNARQQQDYTPLHQAVFNNQPEMVQLLLKYKADVAARTKSGLTPLDIARDKSYEKIVALLAKG